jgi:hypothetical protein
MNKDVNGSYLTAYDIFKSVLEHVRTSKDCKDYKIVADNVNDVKNMRNEIGFKCTKCEESWHIPIRQLRNTMRDPNLKEFGGYNYTEIVNELGRVIKK